MSLSLVFQISLYSLTALSGGMLAMAEERFAPTALSVPLTLLAFFFNERWRVVRIPALWGNVLGVISIATAGFELAGGEQLESQVLAGAHLLVYLTWIVLFQEKGVRQYWWLMALGVLQVAVGSILTLSGWYGVLLVVNLLLSLWTLSVFSMYQGELQFAGLPEGFSAAVVARSAVRGSIQHDTREGWINFRFVGGIFGMAFMGMLLGLGVFFFAPRIWLGNVSAATESDELTSLSFSGFSEEVRLGAMGDILESTDRVMQVGFFNNETNDRIDVQELMEQTGLAEPLFRGMVLDEYSHGKWSTRRNLEGFAAAHAAPRKWSLIRQEYSLEPIGSDVLFAMRPIDGAEFVTTRERISFSPTTFCLFWSRKGSRQPIQYKVFSIDARHLTPKDRKDLRDRDRSRLAYSPPPKRYLDLPGAGLERLRALAAEVTRPEKLIAGPNDSVARRTALTLESHLRDSGIYSYTLSTSIQDPQIDPVEDFLFNRREGHCEYYASALALMLRADGIPARLISGFKGGSLNSLGGYYEVQQRHAHTWVEAYVDNDWLVLDATPAAREASVESFAESFAGLRDAASYIASLWRSYVVMLSYNRQREALYNPLQRSLREGWTSLGASRQRARDLITWIKYLLESPQRWFSWEGGVTAFCLMAFVNTCIWLARKAYRLSQRLRHRLVAAREQAVRLRVEFYERFVKLLAAQGLQGRADQTQREFARQVEQDLSHRLAPAGLAHLPLELSDLFYRVRFGDVALEAGEQATVLRQLDQLEQCLESRERAAKT